MKDGSNWSTLGYRDQRQKNHISYSETQNENNNITRLSTHDDGNLGAVETFQRGGEFFIFYLKLGTILPTKLKSIGFILCFPVGGEPDGEACPTWFWQARVRPWQVFSAALHLFWCLPFIKHIHFDIFLFRTGQAGAGLRKPHTAGGPSPQVGSSSPSQLSLQAQIFDF